MSQSLAKNVLHLVFSTKGREPTITDAVREPLQRYLTGILTDLDSPVLAINSVRDRVHVVFVLNKNRALADVVMEVKRGTSRWLKTQAPGFKGFGWQTGYGAFSVSQSSLAEVKAYVDGQAEHHRVKTFQEEFRAFLKRHDLQFDERYLWD